MIEAALARFIQYAGSAAFFGAALFYLTALPHSGYASASNLRWSRPLLTISASMVAAGAMLSLIFQSATMNGVPLSALDWPAIELVLTATTWGYAIAIRFALAVIALVLTLTLRPRPLWFAAVGLGGAILASFAWSGHGAASVGPWAWLHLISDIAHAIAAGVWIGALICFWFLLRDSRRSETDDGALYNALHGFSGTGSLVVATLVATGIINTLFIVGYPQLGVLFFSPYGAVLAAKLVAFAGMLSLAVVNRFRLTPELQRGNLQDAVSHLRRSVIIEMTLGLLVLMLVGLLGVMEPPSSS